MTTKSLVCSKSSKNVQLLYKFNVLIIKKNRKTDDANNNEKFKMEMANGQVYNCPIICA